MAIQRRRGAALLLAALMMGPRALLARVTAEEKGGGDDLRSPSRRLHRTMMAGIQEMQEIKPSGDIDRDFAQIMRVHHKLAVEMAKEQLASGKSSELKTFARTMVEVQAREIAQLELWLASRP